MKILIVDDHPGTCNALWMGLASMGYDIQTAASGDIAHQMLLSHAVDMPDLLLTDLCMPGMDGLQLIRIAREIRPSILAIVMTAYGSPSVRGKVKMLHPCAYIEKPFTIRKLAETIRCMASKRIPSEESP